MDMGEEVRVRLELNSPGKMYAAGASRISLLGVDMSEVAHVGLELNSPENMLVAAPLGLERQVQRAQLTGDISPRALRPRLGG